MNEIEELDENAQQRRETFARYGLAMYHAQCVEKSLAILVSTVLNKEFMPSDPGRREEIQDEVFSKTIGKLLTRMRKQVTVPPDFTNRVVNIHPALIPSFCGKGFYGHYVHEAVLEYGAKLTGYKSILPTTSTTMVRSSSRRPCP